MGVIQTKDSIVVKQFNDNGGLGFQITGIGTGVQFTVDGEMPVELMTSLLSYLQYYGAHVNKFEAPFSSWMYEDFILNLANVCPQLESFEAHFFMNHNCITDASIQKLVSSCQQLHTLILRDFTGITDASLAAIAYCPNLKHLNLSGCTQVVNLSPTPLPLYYPHLVYLNLAKTGVTDASLQVIASQKLETLCLNDCTNISSFSLEKWSQLKKLCILGCQNVGDDLIRDIGVQLPDLEYLEFNNMEVTDLYMDLLMARCTKLTRLGLKGSGVSKEWVNEALKKYKLVLH